MNEQKNIGLYCFRLLSRFVVHRCHRDFVAEFKYTTAQCTQVHSVKTKFIYHRAEDRLAAANTWEPKNENKIWEFSFHCHWRLPTTSYTTNFSRSLRKQTSESSMRNMKNEQKEKRNFWRDNKNRFNIVPIKLWITLHCTQTGCVLLRQLPFPMLFVCRICPSPSNPSTSYYRFTQIYIYNWLTSVWCLCVCGMCWRSIHQ